MKLAISLGIPDLKVVDSVLPPGSDAVTWEATVRPTPGQSFDTSQKPDMVYHEGVVAIEMPLMAKPLDITVRAQMPESQRTSIRSYLLTAPLTQGESKACFLCLARALSFGEALGTNAH